MSLHKDKFEYMCHRYNRRGILTELPFVSELYQYSISEDKSLAPVGQLRDLGVLVSNGLSWTPHIKTIANKAWQKAAWVLSVFKTRSPVIMLTLYKSIVRSLLEYCCPLWRPFKISDIQELESVQKAFTARITGLHELNYWDLLQRLSLMSLNVVESVTSLCTCGRSFNITLAMISTAVCLQATSWKPCCCSFSV